MGIQINGQTDTISASDGSLSIAGQELTGVTDINASGIITATSFSGDGSGLTGVGGGSSITAGNTSATVTDTGSDGRFVVTTEGSERARVDSSGRLLVGTSSARSIAGITPQSQIEGTSYDSSSFSLTLNSNNAQSPYLEFAKSRGTSNGSSTVVQSGDQLGYIGFAGADGSDLGQNAAAIAAYVDGTPGTNDMPGRLVFSTTADGASSPTERMRILADGLVLFGTTSKINISTDSTDGFVIEPQGTYVVSRANNAVALLRRRSSDGILQQFYRDTSAVGSINVTTSATSYNTSSDYRLKENVTAVADGITRLLQLKPSRFNFIADPDAVVDGFLAHEVQAVVPEAIHGIKDEVDEDGNPVYQGIDQSKLVPLLTAALQEAIGEIESLKARVAALES